MSLALAEQDWGCPDMGALLLLLVAHHAPELAEDVRAGMGGGGR